MRSILSLAFTFILLPSYAQIPNTLYGLARNNNPAAVYLATIDPNTGVVTKISPAPISKGGYSLNAGVTVDPVNLIYYYNDGTDLIGVSLVTGLMVTQQSSLPQQY